MGCRGSGETAVSGAHEETWGLFTGKVAALAEYRYAPLSCDGRLKQGWDSLKIAPQPPSDRPASSRRAVARRARIARQSPSARALAAF